jgi:hypothetical protein
MRRPILALLVTCSCLLVACGDEDTGALPLDATLGEDAESSDVGGATDASSLVDAMVEGAIIIETLMENVQVPIQGSVARVTFDAPEDVLSLTVIVHGDPTGWYGVDSWIDGDGSTLATADWPGTSGNERGCFTCRNFVTQGAGASTTIAPNRDTGAVHPGTHRLGLVGWVDGFAADSVQVTVIAKRGPRMPETGTLDLNFYFTGAQGWTADSVLSDAYFAACVQRVTDLYGRIGIGIGAMTYHDLDPDLSIVSLIEGEETLSALMANSVTSQTDGLNIFFVDQILTGDPDFPAIPGVSASVPNPPYLPGTVASGVAVGTRGPLEVPPAQRFLDPPAIGQTMAHELGHALGLFHTSEYDEVSHDHYADTEENDSGYLMHADGTGDIISAEQGRALLANPAIHHPE